MKRTWLVQRLKRPYPSEGKLSALGETFAFGGGLRNGGLSGEAMGLLRGLFSFDYMGSSEFEWGAVPKALNSIAQRAADFVGFEMQIPLSAVKEPWSLEKRKQPRPKAAAVVYVFCYKADRDETEQKIRDLAADKIDLKESSRFNSALRPSREWDTEVAGWLELDNGFFFFTDRAMFDGVRRLFGSEVVAQNGAA